MLSIIGAQNFKCFKEEVQIPVGRINLLTGINGGGKSTFLQSLLLMHQSLSHSITTDSLVFNGSCVELGNFADVRNAETSRSEEIELMFRFEDGDECIDTRYRFMEDETDEMSAQLHSVTFMGSLDEEEWKLELKNHNGEPTLLQEGQNISGYWRNFIFLQNELPHEFLNFAERMVNFTAVHYVSADRIGPRDYYPKQSFTEFATVGRQGEFTPNILARKGSDVVAEHISLASGETRTLLDQVQAWLSVIFDGARVDVKTAEANIVLMSLNSMEASSGFKPVNVGFGYSYALPIIVAGLIAQPGEILIIENPEAHLHPYAQSQITKFLARVSAQGIQVFIESHSDHVLNALRICVLDDVVQSEDCHILYFGKETSSNIIRIPIQSDGAIEVWPEGFFDQMDKDFSRLFGM